MKKTKGFTSMEIMLVITIIMVLSATVIVAINPFQQMAKAKDLERQTHLDSLKNAIESRISSRFGDWGCDAGDFPSESNDGEPVFVIIGSSSGQYNLCTCLLPQYISSFPVDPQEGQIDDSISCENYNSGYTIWQNPETGQVILRAPHSETKTIESTL